MKPPPLSRSQIDELAGTFLKYLHDAEHPLSSTRETLARAFETFWDKRERVGQPLRKIRYFVMMRMQQKKWMKKKTIRSSPSSKRPRRTTATKTVTAAVLVLVVNRDRKTFPSPKEYKKTVKDLVKQQLAIEQDKHGVTLRVEEEDQDQAHTNGNAGPIKLHAALGKERTITFHLALNKGNDAKQEKDKNKKRHMIFVEKIELRGPHAQSLQPLAPKTVSFLANLPHKLLSVVASKQSTLSLTYRLRTPPKSIKLLRFHLLVSLKSDDSLVGTFQISRSVLIACGNPALDALLTPTSTYQPRPNCKPVTSLLQLNEPGGQGGGRGRGAKGKRNQVAQGKGDNAVGPTIFWPEKPKEEKMKHKKERSSKNAQMFENLGKYPIPKKTIESLDKNEMEGILDSYEWSPKTTWTTRPRLEENNDDNVPGNKPFNVSNESALTTHEENYKSQLAAYGKFWSQLLYISECQSLLEIQLFDMEQVTLERRNESLFALTVPGLAEKRPSVLRGDLVDLHWKKSIYKCRVSATELLQILLQVPPKFAKSFSVAVDQIDLVRFTMSRTTYRTSHRACLELAKRHLGPSILEPTQALVERHRISPVPQVSPSVAGELKTLYFTRKLNPEQEQAVKQIVQRKGGFPFPYILFGPPGTGKTTVVVETIYQLVNQHRKNMGGSSFIPPATILLVTPSNDAADIMVERLADHFPPKDLLRVLAFSRNKEELPKKIRDYANKNEEELSTAMLSSDNCSVDEARLEEILAAKIVVSTINLASRFIYMGVPKGHFNVICVDEAGHATEPEIIGVIASLLDTTPEGSGQLVLAGDPKQLGPITTSKICEDYGHGVSLLERLSRRSVYQRCPDNGTYPTDMITKLVENYRSHPSILKLPNEMFYDGELKCCGDPMVTRSMAKWEHLPKPGNPIVFHSIQGENLREGNSPSWFNPQEAQQVVAYVDLLLNKTKPALKGDEIGIITPYARQAQKIRQALEMMFPRNGIKVGSVETFQGQERRVIVLSTVRSQPELYLDHDIRYNLGFVAHPKRFNVAITRAKALLIVIGCPTVLALDKQNWLPFMKHCHENGSWAGDSWDPASAEEDAEAGDDIVLVEDPWIDGETSGQSFELVQAEETFAFVHREE